MDRGMNHVIEEKLSFSEQFRDFLSANATLLLAAGMALLLISDVFGTHGVLAMRRSQKQAAEIQKRIEQLNQQNQQLEAKVKALKTDPEAVERIAREEMGLAKPGEYIFKIAPSANGNSATSQGAAGSKSKP
ncbi:MAG TPA: septum formation initiator family protein [Candidatus Acidoferrales bacterium]|nr:septum formation initiator family protein [Candidatus Acidoferrales bacterium]